MLKPLSLFSGLTTICLLLFGALAFTNNSSPPTKHSGAPGDLDCADCHGPNNNGTANAAKFFISTQGNVKSFTPGQVVNFTVQVVNPKTSKNGFEVTNRNGSNASFGTLQVTDATNTNLTSKSGLSFVRHTAAGNQHSSWNFAWTAPAVKDTLTAYFYASSVESNNNNNSDNGDDVWVSKFKLPATKNVTSTNAKLIETESLRIFPNPCAEAVHVKFSLKEAAPVIARLINSAGVTKQERTFFMEPGTQTIRWDFDGKPLPGVYVLSLTAGGYTTAQKLLVQ